MMVVSTLKLSPVHTFIFKVNLKLLTGVIGVLMKEKAMKIGQTLLMMVLS